MKKFLPVALLLLLTACGDNAANGGGSKGPISQERSTAFKSFMPTFSAMRKMVQGDEAYDAATFQKLAASFAQEARVPFEHFQSDPQGNGDALPAVWQQADAFKARQEQFFAAVDALNQAAQSGQLDSIKAAFGEAASNCQACHDTFRAPK